ncbi:unnamed protein product [Merluccius merluccius]
MLARCRPGAGPVPARHRSVMSCCRRANGGFRFREPAGPSRVLTGLPKPGGGSVTCGHLLVVHSERRRSGFVPDRRGDPADRAAVIPAEYRPGHVTPPPPRLTPPPHPRLTPPPILQSLPPHNTDSRLSLWFHFRISAGGPLAVSSAASLSSLSQSAARTSERAAVTQIRSGSPARVIPMISTFWDPDATRYTLTSPDPDL